MAADMKMQDADAQEEEQMMYGHGGTTEEELNEKYPSRPHIIHKTLPFYEMLTSLFNPLMDNLKKKPAGPAMSRKKTGPNGQAKLSPHEMRRDIVERFISRWRKLVGDDIYPVFRLVVPEKDRDRPMYGLKELTIGKLLIRVIGIDKSSEDAQNIMNWKLPGQNKSKSAGDFAGRCYEVISKRPILSSYGNMTVAEVNQMLDKLAAASKEEEQYPIFEQFYRRMNADELMWLIRMILRQMKIGATERTLFSIWHPDADNLFNVSSSLRRVCWELYDPSIRVDGERYDITLMQCFQPQLAYFQLGNHDKAVTKMKQTENDDEFWVEEKLDGERMQFHMIEDASVDGGFRFGFWSRKGKDYTYLYGSGYEDEAGSITRHIKGAFKSNVRNIILDGEMVVWNVEQSSWAGFGHLKTAANSERRNPFSDGIRPVFRVFDCLYLNDTPLTDYVLRDRRKALDASLKPVYRRLEIHPYEVAKTADQIDEALRKVILESTEGLVVKNPRSAYRLNERNDDWIKVKPEYMNEYGEKLDCVIIGGYYGSGHRGGNMSSFMCGLRMDAPQIQKGANPQKCYSFFKVGGGLIAADYAAIRHRTEGKWQKWNFKKPPIDWIELAGGDRQFERPDEWIKPEDSVVVEVKATSVASTDQFRTGFTLRFPRFKRLRQDKSWEQALSLIEFMELRRDVEREVKDKKFEVDNERKQRRSTKRPKKKPLTVAGGEDGVDTLYAGPKTKIFEGLTFFVLTKATEPFKKSKADLEQMVKANGGKIVANSEAEGVICVAEENAVKVASIKKHGKLSIVKPSWLFDCIEQSATDPRSENFLLPMEPSHMFHIIPEDTRMIEQNIDEFGDSYCRDVTAAELKEIYKKMPKSETTFNTPCFLSQFQDHNIDLTETPGWMFKDQVIYFDRLVDAMEIDDSSSSDRDNLDLELFREIIAFGGGCVVDDIEDKSVTQIVIGEDKSRVKEILRTLARRPRMPRLVTQDWIRKSWNAGTRVDEERFAVEV